MKQSYIPMYIEELESQPSPPKKLKLMPALYQSKSDKMVSYSRLIETEPELTTLPSFTSRQSTGKKIQFVVNHL